MRASPATVAAAAVAGIALSCGAALPVSTWVGGASGAFETAANWDPEGKPGAGQVASFTNAAAVTVAGGISVGSLSVRGGTVRLSCAGSSTRVIYCDSGDGCCYVDVADGCLLDIVNGATKGADVNLVKTGGGTYAVNFFFDTGIRDLVVSGGVYRVDNNYPSGSIGGRYVIRDGAKILVSRTANDRLFFGDGKYVQVDAGGTLDLSGMSGTGNAWKVYFTGEGSIINAGSETNPLPLYGEDAEGRPVAFDGAISGYVRIVAGAGAGVVTRAGATYVHAEAGDDTWPAGRTLSGNGTVRERSGGTWTISDFSMTGGSLTVEAAATGDELVIAGGSSTNVLVDATARDAYRIVFAGGEHCLAGTLRGERNVTYVQTGGTVWAWPLLSTFAYGSPIVPSYSEIFYTMTGGTLYSKPTTRGGYGLGLEVGGTARAYLSSTEANHHAIGYQTSHTLRVKDDGLVRADYLDLAHYGGGAPTARVELLGGVLQVDNGFGYQHETGAGSAKGEVVFDGGTFVAGNGGLIDVPLKNGIADARFETRVGPGGGVIKVMRTDNFGLNWYGPVGADSAAADGGLVKAGPGILRFARDLELTGPLTVRHGVLRNTGASVTKPFGAGDVVLESGTLSTVEAPVDRTCGTVAYRRAPVVEIGTGLTAAALRREGHGVLFVRHPVAHGVLGESASFRVASGVTAQPVFFVDNDGNIGFLAYDSDRGFVRAASGPSAALVLNNTSPGGACRAEGGTVDFGAAEGLVLATASVSGEAAVLASRLEGTGGVTFASPWTLQNRNLSRRIDVTGANAFSGGSWIEDVTVRVHGPDGLGTGAVTVDGDGDFGGRLVVAADFAGETLANPLVLSGAGPQGAGEDGTEGGALTLLRSVRLTGGVTMASNAVVRLGAGVTAEVASLGLAGSFVGDPDGKRGVLRLTEGRSVLSGGTFGKNVELQVKPGATLDLDGGTLEVDWVKCRADRSNIVNGTLIVRKGYRHPFDAGLLITLRGPPQPLVHLKLDEGEGTVAHDASGHGLDATLVDCEWEDFGQQGGAVRLNGTSSYIEFPKDPRIMGLRDDATYSCWMKIGATGRVSTFSRGGWNVGWTTYICSSHIALGGKMDGTSELASALCLRTIPTGTDPLSPYVHFAMTFSRDENDPSRTVVTFYLNGQRTTGREGETEYVQKGRLAAVAGPPLTVGKYVAYESQWFEGLVDEVKVFGRALTAQEIASDYAKDKVRRSAGPAGEVELGPVELKPLTHSRLAILAVERTGDGWKTDKMRPLEWFEAEAVKCGCTVRVLTDAEAGDTNVLSRANFDTVLLPTTAMPFECEDSLFRFLQAGGTVICRSVLPWAYKDGEADYKDHSNGWYAPFLVRQNPTPEAFRPLIDPLTIDACAAETVGDLLPAVIEPAANVSYRPLDRWQKVKTYDGGYGDTANYSLAADCTYYPFREPNGVGSDFVFHRYYNARIFGATLVQLGTIGERLLKGEKGADVFKAVLHLAEARYPGEHDEDYARAAVRVQRTWSELAFAYMDAVSALRDAACAAYDRAGDAQEETARLNAVEARFAGLDAQRLAQCKLLLADKDAAATREAMVSLQAGIDAAAEEFRAAADAARLAVAGNAGSAWRKTVRHRYGTVPSIASGTMPITLARARTTLFDTIRRIGSTVTSAPLLDWYAGDPVVREKMGDLRRDFKFFYSACPTYSIGGDRLNPANATIQPQADLSYDLDAIRSQLRAQLDRFAWMGTDRLFRIGMGDENGLGCGFWGESARTHFTNELKAEYGTVESLNAACGTDLASFDAVALPVRQPKTQPEHALWELWRLCRERKLCEHYRAFYRIVKEESPGLDTFNIPSCGSFASPLYGVNCYGIFCDTDMSGVDGTCVLDEYEWQYADLCPQKRFLTSEWGGLYTEKTMQYLYGKLWQEMSAGSWGAEQHYWSFGEDSCNYVDFLDYPTKNGAMLWAWLRDVRRFDPLLLDGCRAEPEIGILYSQTARCHDQAWGFEGEARDSVHLQAVTDLYRLFLDWGRSARVIDEAELLADGFRPPKTLFVAHAAYLPVEVQERLNAYASGGGNLIVIGNSGAYDRFGRPSGVLASPTLAKVTATGVESALRALGLSERFAVSDSTRMLREWTYDGGTYLILASRNGAKGQDWGLGEVEIAVRGAVELEDALSGLRPTVRQENGYTVFRTLAVNGARVFRIVSGTIAAADDVAARARPPRYADGEGPGEGGSVRDVELPFEGNLYDETALRCGSVTFSLTTVGSGDSADSGESYLTLREGEANVRQKLVEGEVYELASPGGRTFTVVCRRNFQMFPFYSEIKIEEKTQ